MIRYITFGTIASATFIPCFFVLHLGWAASVMAEILVYTVLAVTAEYRRYKRYQRAMYPGYGKRR